MEKENREENVLATNAVTQNELLSHKLLKQFLRQQKLLIKKFDAVVEKIGETKRKDLWDVLSSLSGVFTFLSSIVIAGLGVYFTDAYKKQDVHIAESQTIEKFLPALNSRDPATTRGALLAIYALQNKELAARLAASYTSSGNLDACETILKNASGESKEQLTDAMVDAYRDRAFDNFYERPPGSSAESVMADFNRILQLRDETYISNKWGKAALAGVYVGRGNVFREKREYEKANADYQKGLQIYPDYYWSFMNIGLMYADQKNFPEAIQYLNKSIEVSTNIAEPYISLGETLETLSRFEEAAANFDKAVEIEPYNTFTFFRRARFYLRRKLYDKAEIDFKAIYELSDNQTDRYRALQELKRINPKYYEMERMRNNTADTPLPPVPPPAP